MLIAKLITTLLFSQRQNIRTLLFFIENEINMDYNRFTIDLIKSSFAQYVATGAINESELDNGISLISKAIDKALISNEETTVLEGLKSDLQYIRYELL
jgi:hypothetical protein